MNLSYLKTFVGVAETLHFGRAAEQLGIAQPVLSRRIQRLETELGEQLFDRDSRNVTLTPAGEALLPRARQILASVERAVDDVRDAARGEAGTLKIGFVGSAGYRVVPYLLRRYREQYPNVALELQELTTARQLTMIESGALDCGIVRSPAVARSLASQTIWREPLIAALPADHRCADKSQITLAELANDSFILFPRGEGPGLHDLIMATCFQAGFSPRIAQQATQMSTVVGLVGAGLGVALVPESVRDFRLAGVQYLITATPIMVELTMIWDQRRRPPLLDNLITLSALPE